ncbi:MAG: N-acetylmuramoyl-L-alanine amidase [Bacteroidales bacterium]
MLIFIIISVAITVQAQKAGVIERIVIDAGHGGKDPGALSGNLKEKDITLAVALKTGALIQKAFPDLELIFTRTDDSFVPLHERARIANESGADLFISIHCNSNTSTKPYGAESYVMGLHKSQENLEVAKTENAAIFYEEDYQEMYEGFNPNSDEDYILLNIFQNASLEQSIELGQLVQKHLSDQAARRDRGVRQAGFWVLYKTTMPGLLVELGFLSNHREAGFLSSKEGQNKLAQALFEAIKEYKEAVDHRVALLKPIPEPDTDTVDYRLRVQFASYKREKKINFRKFRGLENIKVYYHNGMYKYTVGDEKDYNKAVQIKEELKARGFKDVFIVAFRNDERVPLEEALKNLSVSETETKTGS